MISIEEVAKLTRSSLGPITVLTGDDVGQYSQLKQLFLKRIGYANEDLDYSYFDMSETNYTDIQIDLESLPFFADEKVVILDNVLDITTDKKNYLDDKDLKQLETYLENSIETIRIVLFAPGKLDGKRRFVKLLKRDANIYEANSLTEKEFIAYFKSFLRQEELNLAPTVFDALARKSNFSFSDMMTNILFLKNQGNNAQVSLEDIEQAIPKTLQDNLFDLTKMILQGKIDEALTLVKDLRLQGEDDIKLIAVMVSQLRMMLQVGLLAQKGLSQSDIVSNLSDCLGRKVNPYQVKYTLSDIRQVPLSFFKKSLYYLIEADYAIKRGVFDKEYLFELALLKMIQERHHIFS